MPNQVLPGERKAIVLRSTFKTRLRKSYEKKHTTRRLKTFFFFENISLFPYAQNGIRHSVLTNKRKSIIAEKSGKRLFFAFPFFLPLLSALLSVVPTVSRIFSRKVTNKWLEWQSIIAFCGLGSFSEHVKWMSHSKKPRRAPQNQFRSRNSWQAPTAGDQDKASVTHHLQTQIYDELFWVIFSSASASVL